MGKIEFEDVPCLICGSHGSQLITSIEWRSETLDFHLCKHCGLEYLNPRPTQAWYRQFYRNQFWEDLVSGTGWTLSGEQKHKHLLDTAPGGMSPVILKQKKRAERVADMLLKTLKIGPESRVLDVGAAFGFVSLSLQERTGCSIAAIEPSDLAREYIEEYEIELVGRFAEDIAADDTLTNRFDVVFISTALENLNDPLAFIQSVARILATDGQFVSITPNFYYFNAKNPYHPFIFAPETLSYLYNEAGFSITNYVGEPTPHSGTKVLCHDDMFLSRHFALAGTPKKEHAGATPLQLNPEEMLKRRQMGLSVVAQAKASRKRELKKKSRLKKSTSFLESFMKFK